MQCTWCVDPNAAYDDGTLCRPHEAENLGMSVDQIDRMYADQYAEYLDSIS